MTGDYTTDSAIAELERMADAAARESRDLIGRLDRITEEAAGQRYTATSGGVSATVTGGGTLVALTIAAVDRRRPRTEELSADLTAAVLAARTTAATELGTRVRGVVPGFYEDQE
jgi:hypothetical protein